MRLQTSEVWIHYRARGSLRLPFHLGGLVHGLLGQSLWQVGCAAGGCAGRCARRPGCAYAALFSPLVPVPAPHPLLRAGSAAPPPIVPQVPPPGRVAIEAGEELRLGLRLLRPLCATEWAAVLGACEAMAERPWGRERGRVSCWRIDRRPPREVRVFEGREGGAREGRLRLLTPAWLEVGGRLWDGAAFLPLVTSIFRRASALCALYGEVDEAEQGRLPELMEAARGVVVEARRVRQMGWARHSDQAGRGHPMRGLIGELRCAGLTGPLWSVLRAAQEVHVGKGTSFGLGRLLAEGDLGQGVDGQG